jgi:16S rRNA (cytosine967-C5)-methyltransferase
MIAPARTAALTALRDIDTGRLDLPAALAVVRPALQDERDRALATDLVTGTLRWQRQLDYLIADFARRPVEKLDFEVLEVLRLAAYQLLHLDRVPAAAAVNDAVALTRRARKASAAGLVNAVLRSISRNRHRLPLPKPPPDGDPLDYLEVSLSHPRWLASRLLKRYGFERAETWEKFNNTAAPLTVRANTLKTRPEDLARQLEQYGVATGPARFAPEGLIVKSGNPLRSPLANSGLFFLQDEASQLVALLGAPEGGMRVLDACASPGGKTTAMAAMAGDRAHVFAADVRSARVQLLRDTVAASGAKRIQILQADLEAGLPFSPAFDIVFVDAPCSGLGTIRRDPDIRWRRREADLEPLASAQLKMLLQASAVVRPGGRLIYSTCSSEPEENDQVVVEFLRDRPAFTRVDLRRETGMRHFAAIEPLLDDAGVLRTLPDKHGLEAFFGAVLRRVK